MEPREVSRCGAMWLGLGALLFSGCMAGPHTESGMALGTGLGALTGAVIGSQSGHATGGAVIGGLAGAMAGGLVGNAEDARDERDAAVARAQDAQLAAQALTNADLIYMTHNKVSDEVIISAVKSRGGRFDLSPQGIIQLKNSGVSDRVILAVQEASRCAGGRGVATSGDAHLPPMTVVPPGPTVGVVVVPRPAPVFIGPPRPGFHYHHHHRHGW